MRTLAGLAATALLLCAPLGVSLAQNAPDPGTSAAPATSAPPAPPAAPTPPPANAPAPAAQSTSPPAASPPAADTSANPPAKPNEKANEKTATDSAPKTKKKKPAGMTRRQEIEKSIDSGTVPSRYRNSVPKEYQQYIPFSKD